jgi:diphosphomevalonate decarboxylase
MNAATELSAKGPIGDRTHTSASGRGFGHGKVILLGEHAVLYGHPAVALGLSRGLRASVRSGPGHLRVPAWQVDQGPGAQSLLRFGLEAVAGRLGPERWDVVVDADLPAGGGLGSSAAFCVAVARAIADRTGATLGQVAAAVADGEAVFHGQASGVDAAAALHGGLGRFERTTGWQSITPPRPLTVCVGLSGRSHQTGHLVAAIARRYAEEPAARQRIETLGALARQACRTIVDGAEGLGALLDEAQETLAGLGLSCPETDELVALARRAGAREPSSRGPEEAERWWLCRMVRRGKSSRRGPPRAIAVLRRVSVAPRLGVAHARAGTNIALVKYWGKRDPVLNLPAADSLSLTLDAFGTETGVSFEQPAGGSHHGDVVTANGAPADEAFSARVSRFLDLVRTLAAIDLPARVVTSNTVPMASGLASSASGFAALALAGSRAAGLTLAPAQVSALARRGSGSAARSVFGGFVEMQAGTRADGEDSYARPILDPTSWPLRMIVAVTTNEQKPIGSTEAMERTARSSPYYAGWLSACARELTTARHAIERRDLEALGGVMERSALQMHASAMAASPPVFYWNPATVALIHAVWRLRARGTLAFFTIDAGPHVKVLCEPSAVPPVEQALAACPGVLRTIVLSPGPAATLLEDSRR